jgi:hypothetical protein
VLYCFPYYEVNKAMWFPITRLRIAVMAWSALALGAAEPPRQPRIRHFVGLQYPNHARISHVQGDVTFRGFVSSTGKLEQIVVVKA